MTYIAICYRGEYKLMLLAKNDYIEIEDYKYEKYFSRMWFNSLGANLQIFKNVPIVWYFVIWNICEISNNSHWILLLIRKTDNIWQNE